LYPSQSIKSNVDISEQSQLTKNDNKRVVNCLYEQGFPS